jgi:hypothetical protein
MPERCKAQTPIIEDCVTEATTIAAINTKPL